MLRYASSRSVGAGNSQWRSSRIDLAAHGMCGVGSGRHHALSASACAIIQVAIFHRRLWAKCNEQSGVHRAFIGESGFRCSDSIGTRSSLDMESLRRRGVEAPRPRALGAYRQPVADSAGDRAAKARRDHRFRLSPPRGRASGGSERETGRFDLVPDGSSGLSVAHGSVLQHGVHARRGLADLLRRLGQRRG